MCGAYGLGGYSGYKGSINMLLRFQLQNKPKIPESPNIRPTMKSLTVHRSKPNTGEVLAFGIEAAWKEEQLLINAKSETAHQLRTFSKMFRERRCLIPATHYFEWKKNDDGTKTPYLFRLKGKKVFSFAGLFNDKGFVILTTKPNKLGAKVHNRMPCILSKEDEDKWLDEESTENDLIKLLNSFPVSEMEAYAVSTLVNSAKNQSDAILRPLKS